MEEDAWDDPWIEGPPWYPRAPVVVVPDLELLELLASVLTVAVGDRSREVLDRRFGLAGHSPQTLQEIGEALGVTRERVRQIEKKALAVLRAKSTRPVRKPRARDDSALAAHALQIMRGLHRRERYELLIGTFPGVRTQSVGALLYSASGGAIDSQAVVELLHRERAAIEAERVRARTAERLDDRLGAILGQASPQPSEEAPAAWTDLRPCRSVETQADVFWSDKLGRVVECESMLEFSFFDLLECAPLVRRYCEQPLEIRYRWFDGPHRYVPDVAVELDDGRLYIVEVKPRLYWADGRNLAKWNAATQWCADRGWGFVVTDGRRTPVSMLGLASRSDFDVLERITAQGPASYGELRAGWFSSGRTWTILQATALEFGFALQRGPLRVHRARNSPWLDALRTCPPLGAKD